MEDGIRLGQGVVAGVVAEWAFVAERFLGIDVAFDDEVGLLRPSAAEADFGPSRFQFGQNVLSPGQFGDTNQSPGEALPVPSFWPCAHRHFATFVEHNPRDYQRRISRVGESLKGLWV